MEDQAALLRVQIYAAAEYRQGKKTLQQIWPLFNDAKYKNESPSFSAMTKDEIAELLNAGSEWDKKYLKNQ